MDPRAALKERLVVKDLIADIDVKTWGKRNQSQLWHLKTKSGFIKSGNLINVSLTSKQYSYSVLFGYYENVRVNIYVSSLEYCC